MTRDNTATPSSSCASGVLLLVLNDAAANSLLARYTPFQVIFVRSLLALPLIIGLILWQDGTRALGTASIGVHALRGLFAIAGTYAFFLSLRSLPLAEATSLIFASPLFVTALSVPLLREQVSWRRWTAVIVGFAGVLIIVRPGAAAFQAVSLLAVSAALIYALVMISARWIDKRDNFRTMMLYMTLFPALFSAFVIFGEWPQSRARDVLLFLSMAVAGTIGLAMISHAFRIGPASVFAPFD